MVTTSADSPRIAGAVLDHVAHAVPRWTDVWHRYATDLGAVWASGGPGPGFAPGQLRFANGARVEVLMPHDVEVNDFLARFLAHNGPGPHHLTFKVPDLADALERVRWAGYQPINVNTSDPEWMEAFLHPKVACGVVVQLAEAPHPWSSPPPEDYPTARRMRTDGSGPTAPATLERVCHVVADLEAACRLFADLLGGEVTDKGAGDGVRWVDLRWAGPLGIRLVGADAPDRSGPVAEWLGALPGRVHHLALETEEPDAVPGVRPATGGLTVLGTGGADGRWTIDADDNCGLALVLGGFGGATGSNSDGPVA